MKKSLLLGLGAVAMAFAAGATGTRLFFSDGALTEEAKATTEGYVDVYLDLGYSNSNWLSKENAKIYAKWWGSTTKPNSESMSSDQMTKNEFGLYTIEVPSDATGLLFNVNGWAGDCQTVDLTPTSTASLWTITSGYTNGTSQTASRTDYSTQTIYVFDKTGGLLTSSTAYAHVWRDGYSAGTTWHGAKMSSVSGNIYSVDVPSAMNRVIFNNNASSQTSTLTIDGDVSVLEGNWDGSKWTSLLAAQFIDEYMKFDSIDPSTRTQGTDCKADWEDLYTAYTTTYSSVHDDIIAVKDVADRLAAWAEANEASFNKTTGVLSARALPSALVYSDNGSHTALICLISLGALFTVSGFFFLRRRKEDR